MTDNDKVEIVRVQEAHHGQRIDNFLIRHLKGVPRTRIYRLIRRGEVRLNKKRCKPERRLEPGDQIRIPPLARSPSRDIPTISPGLKAQLEASVLFENEELLVVNKPAGMAVHGGSGIRLGLIEALRQIREEWHQAELAHRLDRDTSGCLVIAKNSIALKSLQAEFKAKRVSKHYLALVQGQWPDEVTEVNAPLRKHELNSGERLVRVSPDGKAACTRFRIVRRLPTTTLLEAMPVTGRTHQIRVHCQHSGHAVVGDSRYGDRSHPSSGRIKTLCLHASRIMLSTAPDQVMLDVSAPLDKTFEKVMERLS